jgi:hypothetical protein
MHHLKLLQHLTVLYFDTTTQHQKQPQYLEQQLLSKPILKP